MKNVTDIRYLPKFRIRLTLKQRGETVDVRFEILDLPPHQERIAICRIVKAMLGARRLPYSSFYYRGGRLVFTVCTAETDIQRAVGAVLHDEDIAHTFV